MKKTLHMVCPHCKLKAELNIQEDADMILMRCVACESPFLYFHGETFGVEESEMQNFKQAELKEVEGFLKVEHDEEVEEVDSLNVELSKNQYSLVEERKNKVTELLPSRRYEKSLLNKNNEPIKNDDLINLKIDLENCLDVLEFIQKI